MRAALQNTARSALRIITSAICQLASCNTAVKLCTSALHHTIIFLTEANFPVIQSFDNLLSPQFSSAIDMLKFVEVCDPCGRSVLLGYARLTARQPTTQPLRAYGTGRAGLVRTLLRVAILPPLTASASLGEAMPPAGPGVAIPRAARSTVPGSAAGSSAFMAPTMRCRRASFSSSSALHCHPL